MLPCRAGLSLKGRPFKISIYIQSAMLNGLDGAGLAAQHRPFIVVDAGGKTKQTELGDWSKEKGQWLFREAITIEVTPEDEVSLCVSVHTRYDLIVAAVSLSSRQLGQVSFPASSVLPKLRMEDRDLDGIVYMTDVMPFDIFEDGKCSGRAYLSFETRTPPPTVKAPGSPGADKWCGSDLFGTSSPPPGDGGSRIPVVDGGADSARCSAAYQQMPPVNRLV